MWIYLLSLFGMHCLFNPPCRGTQTVKDFLHESKQRYEALLLTQEPIHFVIGNESADLDSVVSSLVYAFLLHQESSNRGLYLPLINIRREEIALRQDVLYLFQLFELSLEDMLFLDDYVPLESLFAQGRLRLNLVDHNILRLSQRHLSSCVERIIDHHVDENYSYPLLSLNNKIITTVGSAATLIAEKLLSNPSVSAIHELAALLLAPILIDTGNLQSAEKTTNRDKIAAQALWPLAASLLSNDYYQQLMAAKNDITGLTPSLLLSKDYKEYLDGQILYGISSLPPSAFWKPEDFSTLIPILEKYLLERHLTFLMVLMINSDPNGPKRHLIVYSSSKQVGKAFQDHIEKDQTLHSLLIPLSLEDFEQISLYAIEPLVSRKQLQPLFNFAGSDALKTIFSKNREERQGSLE